MFKLSLTGLVLARQNVTYKSALHVIADAIEVANTNIEKTPDPGDPEEYAHATSQDEALIETLLGASFLVLQTQITLILENALQSLTVNHKCKTDCKICAPVKIRLREKGTVFDNEYSKIEILWALANYVKHHEEWSKDNWEKPEGFSKYTVPVIKAIGLHYGSTGNLREAAKALGNESFCDASTFIKIVDDWAKEIYEEASSTST